MARTQKVFKTTEKERIYAREYYRTHASQQKATNKRWREGQAHQIKEYAHARNRRLKLEAITTYGGECACCGVTELEFLVIDHINGGGSQHRRAVKKSGTGNFYLWLINNNFPFGFRVLCHNCNFAIGKFGICPHIQKPPTIEPVMTWHKRPSIFS